MEFFGITLYGPQNYIKDMLKEGYQEPMTKEEVHPLMQMVIEKSTCPQNVQRPDAEVIRTIDCYMGRVNGFAYGSWQRFNKMKIKGLIKPVGPADIYRLPPTRSCEFGWWICDPVLATSTWQKLERRYPQPTSPNTLILDKARKNNKYASLF